MTLLRKVVSGRAVSAMHIALGSKIGSGTCTRSMKLFQSPLPSSRLTNLPVSNVSNSCMCSPAQQCPKTRLVAVHRARTDVRIAPQGPHGALTVCGTRDADIQADLLQVLAVA